MSLRAVTRLARFRASTRSHQSAATSGALPQSASTSRYFHEPVARRDTQREGKRASAESLEPENRSKRGRRSGQAEHNVTEIAPTKRRSSAGAEKVPVKPVKIKSEQIMKPSSPVRKSMAKSTSGGEGVKAGLQKRRSSMKKPLPKAAPPADFEDVWRVVECVRKVRDAPVDTKGAEALGIWSPDSAAPPSEEEYRFAVLVALMLSSQTKDDVVADAVRSLKMKCELDGARPFGPQYILGLTEEVLDGIIRKVGFHNNKTKYLRESSKLLLDPTFQNAEGRSVGAVPHTIEGLLELPGVGPKMGFLVLAVAFNSTDVGIGVDTHMHRIFHDLGWVDSKSHARGPDSTRVVLESFVPTSKWPSINLLFVGFGQQAQQHRVTMLRRCCGADPAYPDFPESTSVPALQLLVKAGGIVSAPGRAYILKAVEIGTKETPLMWAARSGWSATVTFLLELGCDPSQVDASGTTAEGHAIRHGHADVAQLLRCA